MTVQHPDRHGHLRSRTVLTAAGVTLVAAGVELAGSWQSGSLFLAADAVHLVAHLGIFGVLLMPANRRHHELHEDVVTIAVLTLVVLIAGGITVTALREMLSSLTEPPDPSFMVLAILGLSANMVTAYLFKKPAETHWSFRAALAHELSDGALTIAGLVGAVTIRLFGSTWVDPGLSLLVGLWLEVWAGRLLIRRARRGRSVWMQR